MTVFTEDEDETGPQTVTSSDEDCCTEDSEAREVSFRELLQLNRPDWFLVLCGIVLSIVVGTVLPILAFIFSSLLKVSA